MPRGRRTKIEVPTDTQPQFELVDTADDIERRMYREARDDREKRATERGERERERREESQER